MESLFISTPPRLEKTSAAGTSLGDDPTLWPKELISALLGQAGYLGQYKIDQRTLGQDDKRGYAYGYFLVMAPGAPDMRPSDVGPNNPAQPAGPTIRIPFIIEKKKLKPPLVAIDAATGKLFPLTQRRVDSTLYSPVPLEMSRTSTDVGTSSLTGGGSMFPEAPTEGFVKSASLCEAVGKTISPKAKESIAESLAKDPEILHAIEANVEFREKLASFLNAPSQTASDIEGTIRKNLPTDAILLQKTANGYRLTSACTFAFADDVQDLDGKVQTAIPPSMLKEADERGYTVRIRNMGIPSDAPPIPEKIKVSGAYLVQTSTTRMEPALVFTHVRDLDGNPVDQVLVKTASGHAFAEEVFGIPTANVPTALTQMTWKDLPRGKGFFVKESAAGPIASFPVDIQFYEESDGLYAHYSSGAETGSIRLSNGVPHEAGVVKLAAGLYAANPKTFVSFMPLGSRVNLATTVELATKLASARVFGKEVSITHSDGEYSLSGAPVDALGGKTSFINEPTAVFYLGLTGVSPVLGQTKLAEARLFGRSAVQGFRTIKTYEAQQRLAKYAAAKMADNLPGPDNSLLKFAATSLKTDNTIDAVLGLNFITPENLSIFVDYLPAIEDALSKVCELLLSSQLGISDIPEDAASRAITSLEAITAGLNLLRLKGLETQDTQSLGASA